MHTDADRHTDRQTHIQTSTQMYTYIQTHIHTDTHTHLSLERAMKSSEVHFIHTEEGENCRLLAI